MSRGGFIKLSRSLPDHPLWLSEPFTRGQAWVDLLFLANWKPTFFFIRGIKVDVGRGQLAYSVKSLAERWGWSQGKVNRFLDVLQNEEQIVVQKTKLTTLILITNYEDYQSRRNENGEQTSEQTGEQTSDQTETLEEDKEVKNINIPKKQARKTTLPRGFELSDGVRRWAKEKGHTQLDKHFENFVLVAEAKAYKYADWDAALKNAIRNNWAKLEADDWIDDTLRGAI